MVEPKATLRSMTSMTGWMSLGAFSPAGITGLLCGQYRWPPEQTKVDKQANETAWTVK